MRLSKYLFLGLILIASLAFARGDYYKGAKTTQSLTCNVVQTPTEDGASAGSLDAGKSGDDVYVASKFVYTGTNGKAICQINLWLHFNGSSTHNFDVQIWGHDSGDDEPDILSVLGTSDSVDLSGIGGSEVETSFAFSTPTSALSNGTTYWVVLHTASYDASHYADFHYENNGATERRMISSNSPYDGSDGTWAVTDASTSYKFELLSQ